MRNPLRSEILELLVKGPSSPSKMGRALGVSTQIVNYHTKRLVKLGCAEPAGKRRVEGKSVPEHMYRATDRVLIETEDWEELAPEVKDHQVWQYAHAIVDDLELGLKGGTLGPDKHFHLTQTRILVDEEGRDRVMEIQERARLDILEVQTQSLKRLEKAEEEGMDMSSLQGSFPIAPNAR